MFDALGVEFVAADLTKRKGLDTLFKGVEGVFHVAGIHDYSTPDKIMYAINIGGVKNMCDAAVKAKVKRFIHWSSVAVYGCNQNPPIAEDAEKMVPPLNNYYISKWEGEKIVMEYHRKKKLAVTALRPTGIYGPRSEYGVYNVFNLIYKDRKKKKILMAGKGDKIDGFVHVRDVARAAIHAYDTKSMIGEAYNVNDDSRLTSAKFFRMVCKELLGVNKELSPVPVKILIPVAVISQFFARIFGKKSLLEKATIEYLAFDKLWDNSKLKATGFKFLYPDIAKGLKETLDWYKVNGWFRV
jgi:nucleoside-diphosphate-sugar epimerase